MNTVVCIGDSTTFGAKRVDSPTKNLTNRLAEKYPEMRFVNLGINGNTTVQMNARKEDADQYNPFRVIVWGGINDLIKIVGVTAEDIQNELQSMYNYYAGNGYEVWAMTIPPVQYSTVEQDEIRYEVNDWIMAIPTNVDHVIDQFTVLADPDDIIRHKCEYDEGMRSHPAHWNDAGFEAVVAQI